jgi:hypothetical protein
LAPPVPSRLGPVDLERILARTPSATALPPPPPPRSLTPSRGGRLRTTTLILAALWVLGAAAFLLNGPKRARTWEGFFVDGEPDVVSSCALHHQWQRQEQERPKQELRRMVRVSETKALAQE